jgi:Olfactomedin-like domain
MIQCSLVVFNPLNTMYYSGISSSYYQFHLGENVHDDIVFCPEATTLKTILFFPFFLFPVDCLLYAVGKPVYFKSSEQNYGSWLRDPLARNDISAERIWMTKETDGFQLFEFANKGAFRNNNPSKIYNMQFPFQVN